MKEEMNRHVSEFLSPVEFILYADQTIDEALALLRNANIREKIFYFYVLDRKGQLKGVVTTRALVLNPAFVMIGEIMEEVVAFLHANQTLKEAMIIMERHRLLALPVVDDQFRFLGLLDVKVYFDETIETIDRGARRDIFQFIGIKIEEGKIGTAWKGYQLRMPWLLCNVASGLVCAIISNLFQVVLSKLLILAMFIPLVLTLCESVSMQAMTQSLGIVRTPKVLWTLIRKRVVLEVQTVALLSVTCAIGVGLLSWLWGQGWIPVYVIGVALLFAIAVAAMVGMLTPLIFRLCKIDPKLASGPVILMIVDVVATAIYFGVAHLAVH